MISDLNIILGCSGAALPTAPPVPPAAAPLPQPGLPLSQPAPPTRRKKLASKLADNTSCSGQEDTGTVVPRKVNWPI